MWIQNKLNSLEKKKISKGLLKSISWPVLILTEKQYNFAYSEGKLYKKLDVIEENWLYFRNQHAKFSLNQGINPTQQKLISKLFPSVINWSDWLGALVSLSLTTLISNLSRSCFMLLSGCLVTSLPRLTKIISATLGAYSFLETWESM